MLGYGTLSKDSKDVYCEKATSKLDKTLAWANIIIPISSFAVEAKVSSQMLSASSELEIIKLNKADFMNNVVNYGNSGFQSSNDAGALNSFKH